MKENCEAGLVPEVSICCITYNHAAYIREALDSFLAQETSFPFEILVHDDCSTDGTIAILKEYEGRFENVHVFYEERNLNGKGIKGGFIWGFLASRARGRYLAICEGDDYWTNPKKLQIQYDYMEKNPRCAEFVHAAAVIDGVSGRALGTMGMGAHPLDLNARDILKNWSIPTASRFSRREVSLEYASSWDFEKAVGDFPSAIFHSLQGYTHYAPDQMSAYRFQTPGSYSDRIRVSAKASLNTAEKWLRMLSSIDLATNKELHEEIILFAKPYVRLLLRHKGLRCGLPSIGKESRGCFSTKDWARVFAERLLFLLGLVPHANGWGTSKSIRLRKTCD